MMWPDRTILLTIALLLASVPGAHAQASGGAEKISPRPVQKQPLPPEITGSKLYAYSAWTKVCGREAGDPSAPLICLTMLEVKRQAGSFAAGAALIEGVGDKMVLRVTLPADIKREAGARVGVDSDTPLSGKFVGCTARGCVADFAADAQLVAKIKAGEVLHLRGTGEKGNAVSFRLPLAGFATANERAPRTAR